MRIYCAVPTNVTLAFALQKKAYRGWGVKTETITPCSGTTKFPKVALECNDQKIYCKTGTTTSWRVQVFASAYTLGGKTYSLPVGMSGDWINKPCGT